MNKKILIIAGAAVVTILIVGALFVQLMGGSFAAKRSVAFAINEPGVKVTVYQDPDTASSEGKKLTELSSSQTLTLTNGNYYYMVSGENIAAGSEKFTVSGDTTIFVNADYTAQYLVSKLAAELPVINNVIQTQYPKTASGYTINQGKLYGQGQWYATIITDNRSTNKDPFDEHRIVLQKQNDEWIIMTRPQISLSAVDYPAVPHSVLSDINKATIEYLKNWSQPESFN